MEGSDDAGIAAELAAHLKATARAHEEGVPASEGPAPVRQAATVILLRGGDTRLELLLVKRTPKARFMGGVWVFPGGAVEGGDAPASRQSAPPGQGDAPANRPGKPDAGELETQALQGAALRELHEEAGITLADPAELVAFSRWITPKVVPTRFDTHFFLARLPSGQQPRIDGEECVDLRWFTPAGALSAYAGGEIELVFPTIKHLEQLGQFESVDALLAYTRGRQVVPVEPRVVMEGEVARVLLPGDPGY